MSIELIHSDPRLKQYIKDALYEVLYTPISKYLHEQLDLIITKNCMVTGSSHKSFVYKNIDYSLDNSPLPKMRNRLHTSLKPEMDKYLLEVNKLNNEELPFTMGYINQVLNSSNNFKDYLKLLPESLHDKLNQIFDSCPSHNEMLTNEMVEEIKNKNIKSVSLIKERLMKNLLI